MILLAHKHQSGMEVNVKINLGGENKEKRKERKECYIGIKERTAAFSLAMSGKDIWERRGSVALECWIQ